MTKRRSYILDETCDHCDGTGQEVPDCETCDGKGKVKDPNVDLMELVDCPECLNSPCPYCLGKGTL